MSHMVKDQQTAKELRMRAERLKVAQAGALAAGYGPYLIGAGVSGGSAVVTGYKALGPVSKTAINSGAIGSAMDAATQKYECFNCNFNIKQNVGVAVTSAATGAYRMGMSSAAGTTNVTFGNIIKNTNNPTGLVIFGNQQLLNQSGSRAVKSATQNQSQKDQKK